MQQQAALLTEDSVAAVQVRAAAARLGMTDAGVTHHLGNSGNLLAELVRDTGRRMQDGRRLRDDAIPAPTIGPLVHDLDECGRPGPQLHIGIPGQVVSE